MRKVRLLVSALLLTLLAVACAPTVAPAPQPPAPAVGSAPAPAPSKPSAAALAKSAWEMEWEKVLAAGKSEGKVVIASTIGNAVRAPLAEGFKKAYGMPAETILGKPPEVGAKVIAERRAGLYSYDVWLSGAGPTLNIMKPTGALQPLGPALILPEVTDPELIKKVWWGEKLIWADADRILLASAPTPIVPIVINTNLVKEGEIKSYRDLLSPKWKENIVINDPTIAGAGASFLSFADGVLGWDYLVELANNKPTVLRDERQLFEWLAHGKAAIVVGPKIDVMVDFMRIGAPIKGLVPAEGTWMSGGPTDISLFNRSPHPNAAKIFINWYLSKEGQTTISLAAGYQSLRLDVPSDHLPPYMLRQPGVKYFSLEDEKVVLAQPAAQRKARELLGPLMK